jgi:hypothetical protein
MSTYGVAHPLQLPAPVLAPVAFAPEHESSICGSLYLQQPPTPKSAVDDETLLQKRRVDEDSKGETRQRAMVGTARCR